MKIVCWGDYAIPVPDKAKWLSMDADGEWWWHESEPYLSDPRSYGERDKWWKSDCAGGLVCERAQPPEPGPWNTQKYWLEDMQ